ncbi:hypothetical protein [Methylobacter sp. S3L5C]|uniref:hypothetical protein n=1 Tax=Methylobacter sp. S3L5C TaxID=2839024 RepID=UPI001FAC3CEF|nr:hypothetical protein [Methylobacter sp. S3L5C]UOA08582.1 hypothetical protein KKZ03_20725 [Methylobacter sp. S3L5C]
MAKPKSPPLKKLTISLHSSVMDKVNEIALTENLLLTSQLRKMIHSSLKQDYSVNVRGNKVVSD